MEDYNRGIKEQPPFITDWLVGAESGIVYEPRNITGDWRYYLSQSEYQKISFETFGCTVFAGTNSVEAQCNFLLSQGKFTPNQVAGLTAAGYIINDKFNFSDRFTYVMSGTTKDGNYIYKVWDSMRKDGLLPEADWPMTSSYEKYVTEIPQELKNKAKIFLDYVTINYEWCARFQVTEALKQAPIQIASPACPTWQTGDVLTCGLTQSTHSTLLAGEDFWHYFIEDHYSPFKKQLQKDYPINSFLKGVVNAKAPVITVLHVVHNFTKNMELFNYGEEVLLLQAFLKEQGYFKLEPTGFFGFNTRNSVIAFQEDHRDEILTPLGLTYGTGRVYEYTRAVINKYTNL